MTTQRVSLTSQVTLPKEFAGKTVLIERVSAEIISIRLKPEQVIPDAERIFHAPTYQQRLAEFDQWMNQHQPEESDLEALSQQKLA